MAVCTFRRNDALDRLLHAVRRNAATVAPGVQVGVVVVDDNPDGRAREVCDRHARSYPLGLHYRSCGHGNISLARNAGLDAALPMSDWIAMTDDDCEPADTWIASYLETQRATGASALTGPCYLDLGPDAPSWLRQQPFQDDGQLRFADCERLRTAATNNSFVRSAFLCERPWLRFEPDLGVTGGEDMVFFRTAHAAGLDIAFSAGARVIGHEPRVRATFGYQVRSRFWLGNTEYVTNAYLGDASPGRWLLLSVKRLVAALSRPVGRLMLGRRPQFRYALASAARAMGNATGVFGLRARHH